MCCEDDKVVFAFVLYMLTYIAGNILMEFCGYRTESSPQDRTHGSWLRSAGCPG